MNISKQSAIFVVVVLLLVQFFGVFGITFPLDNPTYNDATSYHYFMDRLIEDRTVDFSQSGFVGAILPAIVVHLLVPFNHSFAITQVFFALLTLPLFYLVTLRLFKSQEMAVMGVLVWAMMPELIFSGFYGFPQGVSNFASLLAIYLVLGESRWAWAAWYWAVIAKPFALAVGVFFIAKKWWRQMVIVGGLGVLYLAGQWSIHGRLILGVHPELSLSETVTPTRIGYNLASMPPILFSLHGYNALGEFSGNAPTSMGDRLHTSPLIVVFALVSVLYFKNEFADEIVYWQVVGFSAAGLMLACLAMFVDPLYLQTFTIGAIWLSLPVLKKYPLLLPIVMGTMAYQFVYTYLSGINLWAGSKGLLLFVIPMVGLVVSVWLVGEEIMERLRVGYGSFVEWINGNNND